METDDEREVRLERQRYRQREIRDVETAEQREARLKIMRERLLSKVIFPLKYLTSGFFLLAFIGETTTNL